jgi:outer membrane protein TolC
MRALRVCGLLVLSFGVLRAEAPAAEAPPAGAIEPAVVGPERLTLERAYALALASDESLRSALLEIRKRERERWSALTRLGPEVVASYGLEETREGRELRRDRLPVRFDSFDRLGQNSSGSRAQLAWRQTLFDFTTFPAWRQARLSVEIAELRRRFTARQVLFGVARAYYGVLKQESAVAIAAETVELAGRQFRQAEDRLAVGDAVRTDVLAAEAARQSARRALIEAESALEQLRFELAQILGLDPDGPAPALVEPEPLGLAPEEPPAVVFARALERREDYLTSRRTVEQLREQRAEVAASYAPRLVAQASYDWTDIDSNRSNADRQEIWSAAVAVQVPIFTGGQREVDLGRTRIGIQQARLDLARLEKDIRTELHGARLEAATLAEAIVALRAEEEAAARQHAALAASYAAGASTSLDVLAALRDLNRARTLLTGALHDQQVALLNQRRVEATFAAEWIEEEAAPLR